MASESPSGLLRPLGGNERMFLKLTTVFASLFSGVLSPEIAVAAFRGLAQRHPLLRSWIVERGDSNDIWWKEQALPETDQAVAELLFGYRSVEIDDSVDFVHAVEQATRDGLIGHKWACNARLFQCEHLRQKSLARSAIILWFSHGVMDGLSRLAFMTDFVSFANQAAEGTLPRVVPSLALLPDQLSMLPPNDPLFGPDDPPEPTDQLQALPTDGKPGDRMSDIFFHHIAAVDIERIRVRCRQGGSTVSRALVGCFAASLDEILHDCGVVTLDQSYSMLIGVPFSCRGSLTPPVAPAQLGNFAVPCSAMLHDLKPASEDFTNVLALSERFNEDLQQRAVAKAVFKGLLRQSSAGLPPPALIVSNTGVVNTPRDKGLCLTAMYSSIEVGDSPFVFCGVQTVPGEGLNLGVAFSPRQHSPRTVRNLVHGAMARLLALALPEER